MTYIIKWILMTLWGKMCFVAVWGGPVAEQGSLASNGPVPLPCPAEGANVTASDQNVSNAVICQNIHAEHKQPVLECTPKMEATWIPPAQFTTMQILPQLQTAPERRRKQFSSLTSLFTPFIFFDFSIWELAQPTACPAADTSYWYIYHVGLALRL